MRKCIALDGARAAVIDSYISECHRRSTQAIAGTNGPGHSRSLTTISGVRRNISWGGADPGIVGRSGRHRIRRNHIKKSRVAGYAVGRKEPDPNQKNSTRVLVGATCSNSWVNGQVGYARPLSVNQLGGCPLCVTSH
jgi:hypothetical protein